MNLKAIILSLCVASSVSVARAESKFTPSEKKHDIRLSVSDGTTLTMTDIFGNGFSDALLGSKRSDEKSNRSVRTGIPLQHQPFQSGR